MCSPHGQPGLATLQTRDGVHVICYRVVWRCSRIANRHEERCFYWRYATLQPLIVSGGRFARWPIDWADTRTTAGPPAQRVFARLPDDEVDAILEHAVIRRYAAGAQIFYKGDPGSSMMAVLRGRVVIRAPSSEGKEIILNIINEGEIFGEIALLDGKERTADATAMTDCELLVVSRRSFLPLLERPDTTRELLNVLCERLRRTSEQVEDVLFLDVGARIAKTLLRFTNAGGAVQPGVRIVLGMSQRELGNLAGVSREKVNRKLQAWRRAGIITVDKGTIFIRDPAALRSLSN